MSRDTHTPPQSAGEVAASYADGGVMSDAMAIVTPPSRHDRDTSPEDGGGKL